jgi:hypothetical protein
MPKLVVVNTEVGTVGTQMLDFYLARHGIGATTWEGDERALNRIRNCAAGTRVLIHGQHSEIRALGVLSAEPAKEVLRTVTLEQSPDEEKWATGAILAARVVYRTLDHFHQFDQPVSLSKELGWTKHVVPIKYTVNEIPDDDDAEKIWAKAVDCAIKQMTKALL